MSAPRFAVLGVLGLLLLQYGWYVWWHPIAGVGDHWLAASMIAAPLWIVVILLALRRPRAAFWGALAALLYFSHGVMEAWSAPEVRLLAWIEIGLSLLAIGGASWSGMRARFGTRRADGGR